MIDYFEMVHVDGQVKHRNVGLKELRLKPKKLSAVKRAAPYK